MNCMPIITGGGLKASSVYDITDAPSSTAVPITRSTFCNGLF